MPIRFATPADGAVLLSIYAPYIDTPITFECTSPTVPEFTRRIEAITREYPYLVYEEEGRPIGFAYAHRAQAREAYQWNAELSVYLAVGCTGRGIGTALYRVLIELLKRQGICTVYGVVTVPNPASERLHRALGFRRVGTWRRAGYKAGAWRDVAWFEKAIAPFAADPPPLLPFSRFSRAEREGWLQTAVASTADARGRTLDE